MATTRSSSQEMEDINTPGYTDSETNPNTSASSIAGDFQDGRKRRSEASQLRKSMFGKKHDRLGESKDDDSIRRYRYLLGLTDLFRHFIETNPNARVREIIAEIDRQDAAENSKGKRDQARKGGAATGGRKRRTEAEEDAALLREGKRDNEVETIFRESPAFINGQMRDYQVAGLNWLVSLHENGISGILADEMGLGKTLQTISFLGYLRFNCGINGPHLVVVPKSTLDNWRRELQHWINEINVVVLTGAKEERQQLIKDKIVDEKFDVLVTSYEMILIEKAHLKKFAWEYIIIDEAHRIKNEESSLSQVIRIFNSRNRLLITGTPLQNNLHELWALLNFLLPDVFGDSEAFDAWFSNQSADQDTVVQQLHKILRPFLLRRVKNDVEKSLLPKKEVNLYVPMSDMQVKWYQKILTKDIDAVNNAGGNKESKTRLLNIVMQLRKCCNHPYLFDGAEPGPPYTTDEHLVFNSKKMEVLDRLLDRMKKDGSRVLIFSQMSRVLDILEDYSVFRGYQYCRIDGGTAHEDRINAIDEYNKPNSEKFLFLLTTRAGGLGINLNTADVVVLFDSDWNPQADLQAMDRAHRIGQTKQVYVYRLVTEKAVEEKVLERAAQKLRLDQLVIQQGRAQQPKQTASKDELVSILQYGAEDIMQRANNVAENGAQDGEDDIDAILRRGQERTAELNAKYEKLGLDDLQNFTSDSGAYEWNGETFQKNKRESINANWINPAKRERKEQIYSIDKYYRQALATGGPRPDPKPKVPRAPKQIQIHDYQFFDPRLAELQDKETACFRKENNIKAPLADGEEDTLEQREEDQKLEQTEIDNAEPLTEAEHDEKEKLANKGFPEWNRRDFQQFINGSAKYGRHNYDMIAEEVDSKESDQIAQYAKAFWKKYKLIDNWEKHMETIETGEERIQKQQAQKKWLDEKMRQYKHNPLHNLKLSYSVSTTNKKVYTEEEDRFLLVMMQKYGIDSENLSDKIKDEIRESPLFRFDWFFLSRTPTEISRRCQTLLTTVQREFEPNAGDGRSTNGKKRVQPEDEESAEEEDEEEEQKAPPKKKAKAATPKNKHIDSVKQSSASASRAGSRRVSSSPVPASTGKGKAKGRKK